MNQLKFVQLRSDDSDDYLSLTLEERVAVQKSTFHWYPYQRILYNVLDDGSFERICPTRNSSIEEFPQIFESSE